MTTAHLTLSAEPRAAQGKKNLQLRKQNLIPANIFGDVDQSVSIQLKGKEFSKLYNEAGESSVIYLSVTGDAKERPVLVSEVQRDPRTHQFIHVSLRQVNLREKVTADIEIELVGELTVADAVPVLVKEILSVEALPTDLPESFEIDLSRFTEIGQEVLVKDLAFDSNKVEIDAELDEVVLQIQKAEQMAEVEEPAPEAEGEADAATPAASESESAAEATPTEENK